MKLGMNHVQTDIHMRMANISAIPAMMDLPEEKQCAKIAKRPTSTAKYLKKMTV